MLQRCRHRLGRDPVEEDAVGDLARQLQHPRAEGGQVDPDRPGGEGARHPEVLDAVEFALDVDALAGGRPADDLHRLAVLGEGGGDGEAVPVADDDAAREPEPESEAAGGGVVEGGRGEGEDDRRPGLDGHHAGGQMHALGMAGDQGQEGEGVATRDLARPGGVIAASLRLVGGGHELGGRQGGERREDDPEAGHPSVLRAFRAPRAADSRNRWSFNIPTIRQPSRMRRFAASRDWGSWHGSIASCQEGEPGAVVCAP
jgi:hypothetical protein